MVWQKASTIQKPHGCIPHLFKGEGQFVARFRYLGENRPAKVPSKKDQLSAEQKKWWQEFAKKHLKITLEGVLETFGDELYLVPFRFTRFAK